ncbi:MAG: hypothetical protein DRM99_02360 [Thermoplasmata archaeon]|nr:MAG: hypothetical protein DRM99_02360 [Thermoplasmata archaeon]
MNKTNRWVICRKEKRCKRCKNIIRVGEKCWRYGSVYIPFFMCKACKIKMDIKEYAENIETKLNYMKELGLSESEYERWIKISTDSMVINRFERLRKAIIQHNNPNSPFFRKKSERIKQLFTELLNLGVPKKIILKEMVETYKLIKNI